MRAEKPPLYFKKSLLIFQYIRAKGSVSKQDIVVGLNLSLPTITQNLNYLIDLKLIDDSEKIMNTGGRSAIAYTYMPKARVAIGAHLTAHHISVLSVDMCGNVIVMEKETIDFDLKSDAYLRRLGELVEMVKQKTAVPDENLLGVGISVQGLVTNDGEEVTYGLTLNFTGTTRRQVAKYIPYNNQLFHDSEQAGYAEVWIDDDTEDAFYLMLSNSVGGAVILGNEIHYGEGNKAGEIGHMTVDDHSDRQCYCGKYGCLDTVLSAANLADFADGSLENFFVMLDSGDAGAKAMWDEYLRYLSLAIHNARMMFSCNIILGGYVGSCITPYIDELCARVDARDPFGESAKDYLQPCKYKTEASAAGAAISYINRFIENI